MSRTSRPYPEYKDSGVPWLDKIPTHWEIRRGKTLFRCIDVRSETGEEELLSVSENYGVVPRRHTTVTMFKAESYVGHKLCWPGDLVINTLWAWKGGLGFSRYYGIVSSVYGVYRLIPNYSIYWQFLDHLLRSKVYDWEFHVKSKGVWVSRLKITDDDFLTMPIIVPPPDEADQIALFLDHLDRLTRRYIRAQRRLIELLTEQKQALIHQAVTRGLDPTVPLKDSGIEWLGEIPAHWEIVRIKYLLREIDERSTTGQETLLSLRMNHGLVPHDEHFARPGQASTLVGYKLVRPGQVVLNKLQANNGLIFASEVFGLVSPDYAVFDPIADVDLYYLTALFRTPTMKYKFRVEAKGLGTGTSGFLRLYTDRFGAILVSLPPRNEQSKIMHELGALLQGLQDAIARAQRQIDLIREYRTRLITDVVTGQLDVRGISLPDLDQAEDVGDLDDLEEDAELDGLDAEELNDAE